MEIWLTNDLNDKIQLPVNPPSIGYKDGRNFIDLLLASGDEKTVISGRNLRTYTISSFFPKVWAPYCAYSDISDPMTYVNLLKSWMDNKYVILLQATTTLINEKVTIRNFEWNEKGGAVGDIEYTLELKEFQPVTFVDLTNRQSNKEKPAMSETGTKPRPASSKKPPKTYTVKKGDTLWAISRRYLGKGAIWQKIYSANKSIIGSNPNLIKPGQELVIPS